MDLQKVIHILSFSRDKLLKAHISFRPEWLVLNQGIVYEPTGPQMRHQMKLGTSRTISNTPLDPVLNKSFGNESILGLMISRIYSYLVGHPRRAQQFHSGICCILRLCIHNISLDFARRFLTNFLGNHPLKHFALDLQSIITHVFPAATAKLHAIKSFGECRRQIVSRLSTDFFCLHCSRLGSSA